MPYWKQEMKLQQQKLQSLKKPEPSFSYQEPPYSSYSAGWLTLPSTAAGAPAASPATTNPAPLGSSHEESEADELTQQEYSLFLRKDPLYEQAINQLLLAINPSLQDVLNQLPLQWKRQRVISHNDNLQTPEQAADWFRQALEQTL